MMRLLNIHLTFYMVMMDRCQSEVHTTRLERIALTEARAVCPI